MLSFVASCPSHFGFIRQNMKDQRSNRCIFCVTWDLSSGRGEKVEVTLESRPLGEYFEFMKVIKFIWKRILFGNKRWVLIEDYFIC